MEEEDFKRVLKDSLKDHTREETKIIVQEVLTGVGINAATEEQADEMREDFHHLRKSRKGAEELGRYGKKTVVVTCISSVCALIIFGVKSWLKNP